MFEFCLNLNGMEIVKINSCVLRSPAIYMEQKGGETTMSETKFFLNFRKFKIKKIPIGTKND